MYRALNEKSRETQTPLRYSDFENGFSRVASLNLGKSDGCRVRHVESR